MYAAFAASRLSSAIVPCHTSEFETLLLLHLLVCVFLFFFLASWIVYEAMSGENAESLKSHLFHLIHQRKSMLAWSGSVRGLRFEVSGVQRDSIFIEGLLRDLQQRLEDADDLESLQSIGAEVRSISAWRQEMDAMSGKLRTIELKADEMKASPQPPKSPRTFGINKVTANTVLTLKAVHSVYLVQFP